MTFKLDVQRTNYLNVFFILKTKLPVYEIASRVNKNKRKSRSKFAEKTIT